MNSIAGVLLMYLNEEVCPCHMTRTCDLAKQKYLKIRFSTSSESLSMLE